MTTTKKHRSVNEINFTAFANKPIDDIISEYDQGLKLTIEPDNNLNTNPVTKRISKLSDEWNIDENKSINTNRDLSPSKRILGEMKSKLKRKTTLAVK